jgi:phosphoribosylformimino-5-aminoimidazole carboxamide ribotide isomerase
MLLIIPAIRIKNGKCIFKSRTPDGAECSDDPIDMAKLWRTENAKSLHVTDVDGIEAGHLINLDVIKSIMKAVDIPIEIGGGIRSFEEAQKAFDAGAYRILIGTFFLENPEEALRILNVYGESKVVIGLDIENGEVVAKGWPQNSALSAIDAVLKGKSLGFKRMVYRDVIYEGETRRPNFDAIKNLAEVCKIRITASGGVENLNDLFKIRELTQYGVDSVIIGKALYENRFSCQNIWRICEAEHYPFTAKI